MPDNVNQSKIISEVPLEPAPEVIAASALPNSPANSSIPSTQPISPNPPTPPTPPPPLPKSEILTPDIAPKKPSKAKIILTSVVGLFLLVSVASAVVLVKQNQDLKKYAATCDNIGDSCTDSYPENCTTTDGQAGTRQCNKVGTCTGVGGGDQCSWGPGSSCGTCTPNTPPPGDCVSEGSSGCSSQSCCTSSNVCHNNVCTACGSIGDESTCWTHSNCHWDGSCKTGAMPTVTGECKIDCGADRNGVSVTAQGGSETACSGAVVTATYFAKTCNSSNSCAGATTTATGGLPFTRSTIGDDCGYYQTDIVASTNKGGSCRNASAGPIGACATPTPTTPRDRPTSGPTLEPPTPTPTTPRDRPTSGPTLEPPTPTPTTGTVCECVVVKVYNSSWRQYQASELSGIKPGTEVIFTVEGSTNQGIIDKARFNISDDQDRVAYLPTTDKKPNTKGEFYVEFTIPADATSIRVKAEVGLDNGDWY